MMQLPPPPAYYNAGAQPPAGAAPGPPGAPSPYGAPPAGPSSVPHGAPYYPPPPPNAYGPPGGGYQQPPYGGYPQGGPPYRPPGGGHPGGRSFPSAYGGFGSVPSSSMSVAPTYMPAIPFPSEEEMVNRPPPTQNCDPYDETWPTYNIFVGDLTPDFTEADIYEAYQSAGPIHSVLVVKDKATGLAKGFGFCNFLTCLVEGTLVATTEGPVAVEKVTESMQLIGEGGRIVGIQKLTKPFPVSQVYRLQTASGRSYEMSENHQITLRWNGSISVKTEGAEMSIHAQTQSPPAFFGDLDAGVNDKIVQMRVQIEGDDSCSIKKQRLDGVSVEESTEEFHLDLTQAFAAAAYDAEVARELTQYSTVAAKSEDAEMAHVEVTAPRSNKRKMAAEEEAKQVTRAELKDVALQTLLSQEQQQLLYQGQLIELSAKYLFQHPDLLQSLSAVLVEPTAPAPRSLNQWLPLSAHNSPSTIGFHLMHPLDSKPSNSFANVEKSLAYLGVDAAPIAVNEFHASAAAEFSIECEDHVRMTLESHFSDIAAFGAFSKFQWLTFLNQSPSRFTKLSSSPITRGSVNGLNIRFNSSRSQQTHSTNVWFLPHPCKIAHSTQLLSQLGSLFNLSTEQIAVAQTKFEKDSFEPFTIERLEQDRRVVDIEIAGQTDESKRYVLANGLLTHNSAAKDFALEHMKTAYARGIPVRSFVSDSKNALNINNIPASVTPAAAKQELERIGGPLLGEPTMISPGKWLVTYINYRRAEKALSLLNGKPFGLTPGGPIMSANLAVGKPTIKAPAKPGGTLFIKNIAATVDEAGLAAYFGKFAKVVRSTIVRDRMTQESKGFGFIALENEEEALKALASTNLTILENKMLSVELAKLPDASAAHLSRSGEGGKPGPAVLGANPLPNPIASSLASVLPARTSMVQRKEPKSRHQNDGDGGFTNPRGFADAAMDSKVGLSFYDDAWTTDKVTQAAIVTGTCLPPTPGPIMKDGKMVGWGVPSDDKLIGTVAPAQGSAEAKCKVQRKLLAPSASQLTTLQTVQLFNAFPGPVLPTQQFASAAPVFGGRGH